MDHTEIIFQDLGLQISDGPCDDEDEDDEDEYNEVNFYDDEYYDDYYDDYYDEYYDEENQESDSLSDVEQLAVSIPDSVSDSPHLPIDLKTSNLDVSDYETGKSETE